MRPPSRAGYPPPKPLTPASEKRLHNISIMLVALGLTNTIRMLATGKRPPAKRARILRLDQPSSLGAIGGR